MDQNKNERPIIVIKGGKTFFKFFWAAFGIVVGAVFAIIFLVSLWYLFLWAARSGLFGSGSGYFF